MTTDGRWPCDRWLGTQNLGVRERTTCAPSWRSWPVIGSSSIVEFEKAGFCRSRRERNGAAARNATGRVVGRRKRAIHRRRHRPNIATSRISNGRIWNRSNENLHRKSTQIRHVFVPQSTHKMKHCKRTKTQRLKDQKTLDVAGLADRSAVCVCHGLESASDPRLPPTYCQTVRPEDGAEEIANVSKFAACRLWARR